MRVCARCQRPIRPGCYVRGRLTSVDPRPGVERGRWTPALARFHTDTLRFRRQATTRGATPMSTEKNRRTIESYFQAVNRGDKDGILKFLTDDFVFKGMGRHPDWMRYQWGRDAFADAPRDMSTKMKKPITMNLL